MQIILKEINFHPIFFNPGQVAQILSILFLRGIDYFLFIKNKTDYEFKPN